MSARSLSLQSLTTKERRHVAWRALWLLAASLAGVVAAYLIVDGQWQVAALLISLLPVLILLHRYPFLAVVIWLAAMPFLLHTPTAAERQLYWMIHRALPPLTVVIMLTASLARINRYTWPRLGAPEFAMAGYVGLTLLSIYQEHAAPLDTTYEFYDRVVAPMCLYLIVRLSGLGEKEIKWLVVIAFFIAVSQSTIGVLSWFTPEVLPATWLDKAGSRTVGSLVNTSVYTIALAFSGLLALHVAQNSRPGLLPTFLQLAFVLSAYSIFVSFSRASWIVGVLLAVGLLYLYPKAVVRLGLVVGISLTFVGTGLLTDQISWARQRLYSEEAERSAVNRLPVAYAAIRMFEAKPVFGWGYETFDLHDRRFYEQIMGLPYDGADRASHNTYLTILAEQGIAGLLLYIGPLFGWLALTLKRLPGMPRTGLWSRRLLITLWLALLAHIVVGNFSRMQVVYGLGLWWIILALIACLVDDHRFRATQGAAEPRPLAVSEARSRKHSWSNGMYETLERTWVSLLNSNRFRRFAKQGLGSGVFRSQAYRKLIMTRNHLSSLYARLRYPSAFQDVDTFCLFVGHNKSGTSMIGSLLDAHPNVVLADEVHALDYVSAGFTREQVFHILLRGSRREFLKGRVTARRLTPYSYLVPGQWQGRFTRLRVIGDGASSSSTRRFATDPDLLQQLQRVMRAVDVKFIQVIRNPYDPISVMMVRGKRSFENAIEQYFANCETLVELRKRLNDSNLFAVRYEDFVSQPELHLTRLCGYLGIESDAEYLRACVGILHQSPDQNRHMVMWEPKWIDAVKERLERYDFLQGYSFEQ